MFNKEEIEPIKQDLTESCFKCKHLVLKRDMKKVIIESFSWMGGGVTEAWYCPEDKPNYTRVYRDLNYKNHYYKELEVADTGVPLGYVVIPDKK